MHVSTSARSQIPQRRPGGLAAGVAADHATALFPATLAFDFVGGGAVLGHAPGHAHSPAVAAEELPMLQSRGLAIAFTLRAICDSDNPNTFSLPAAPTGRMAFKAFMAVGVMATTAPWASVSVLERMTVIRPLPSSQRTTSLQVSDAASERLNPPSDNTATRARSKRARWAACSAVSKPRPRLRGWTAVSGSRRGRRR